MVEKDEKLIDDDRVKFLEALEKKKVSSNSGNSAGPLSGSKVGGGQVSAITQKRFQRKSGSA